MKKILCVTLVTFLCLASNVVFGAQESPSTTKERPKFSTTQFVTAALGLAGSAAVSIPKLIPQIKEFPDRAKPQLQQLIDGITWVAKLPQNTEAEKEDREIAIQELFLLAVNLLVDVNNIADNVFAMVKQFGPLVSAVDKDAGSKINEAVKIMADSLYAVSLVSKGMAKYVRTDLQTKGESPVQEASKIEKPTNL